ncbi:MAG TPA: hypothetical protein VFT87_03570 [Candidatus Saccharimonadales bacterium]|nr:hypothetical protein [Candidatus Saccharimonadales bacterium]
MIDELTLSYEQAAANLSCLRSVTQSSIIFCIPLAYLDLLSAINIKRERIMQTPNTKNNHHTAAVVLGTVTVKPHQLVALNVGIYESGMPEPELYLTVEPDIGSLLGSSLERLESKKDAGEYRLVYHFQSYSDQPCVVTVSLRERRL